MLVSRSAGAGASGANGWSPAPNLAVVERALRLQALDSDDGGSAADDRRARLRAVLMQAEGLRASVQGAAARQRLANVVDEASASARVMLAARRAGVEAANEPLRPEAAAALNMPAVSVVYAADGAGGLDLGAGAAVDTYA